MTLPAPRVAAIALLLIVAASSAHGSPGALQADSTVRAADAIVREWVDAGRIPGAVLLVSRDGRVVFERAYGWAQLNEYGDGQYGVSAAGEARPSAMRRLRDPRPMTTDTVFDLASVTKVMATTFAVMLLVGAGELDLDATVTSYLPDFRDAEEPPATPPGGAEETVAAAPGGAGKRSITLRHLLTHRSGLSPWKPVYYRADNAKQAYEYIRDLPLAWPVGSERHYSDLGFMLLARVVARVAGESLDAFLDERLYEPLGLSATGFRPGTPAGTPALPGTTRPTTAFAATSHGNPYEHRMVHDPDFGYRIEGDANTWNGWRQYTLAGEVNDGNAFHAFNGIAGHAGLFSTAADLQVLLQLLLNGGEYDGRRYLSADIVDEFLASTGDGQALGWQVPDDLPEGSFNHTGFTGTYLAGIPAKNVAIVLLTNRQNLGVNDHGQYPDIGELQRSVVRAVVESR